MDLAIIRAKRFEDIVRVGDIFGSLDQVRMAVTFSKDFPSGKLISFQHLHGEDVVNLNIMG